MTKSAPHTPLSKIIGEMHDYALARSKENRTANEKNANRDTSATHYYANTPGFESRDCVASHLNWIDLEEISGRYVVNNNIDYTRTESISDRLSAEMPKRGPEYKWDSTANNPSNHLRLKQARKLLSYTMDSGDKKDQRAALKLLADIYAGACKTGRDSSIKDADEDFKKLQDIRAKSLIGSLTSTGIGTRTQN